MNMECTIKSKILNRTLTFSRPGSEYIYVDLNGQSGTLGVQICRAGSTMGSTIGHIGDDPKIFKSICKSWYTAYLRAAQLHGVY